jgi:hypothetical protein
MPTLRLLNAIKRRDTEGIEEALKAGASSNARYTGFNERTLFGRVLLSPRSYPPEIIRLFLTRGAQIEEQDSLLLRRALASCKFTKEELLILVLTQTNPQTKKLLLDLEA